MKNQVVYQSVYTNESLNVVVEKIKGISFAQLMIVIRQWILSTRPFVTLSQFCSQVLGEEVSTLKAFNLVHAFVAFFAMLLLGGNSWLLQIALIAWFAVTALQCKRDGWSQE